MGRREKHRGKLEKGEEEEPPQSVVTAHSTDDEEANEDLSLKIVEKALLVRAARLNSGTDGEGNQTRDGVHELLDIASEVADAGTVSSGDGLFLGEAVVSTTVKKSKKKKKKSEKVEMQEQQCVVDLKEDEKVELVKVEEGKAESTNSDFAETSDNMVLKKLLRGPRYFDPPDSGWGTCYNCGEEGHTTLNCTSARRKKPCFVCGSLDHTHKQCLKGQDCFICKKGGHRAKDCPERQKGGPQHSKICLKCGESGHDMFSCRNNYSPDDLKEIQCYICRTFGHLCCANVVDSSPHQVSCYKCGQHGHTGLACMRLRGESNGEVTPSSCYKCGEEGHFARECMSSGKAFTRLHRDSNGTATPNSCYRCGEEGHFARECASYTKVRWNGNISTPGLRPHRDNGNVKSAPNDLGKARKRKKEQSEERGTAPRKSKQFEERVTAPRKSKHRGGWIMDDPGEFSDMKPEKKRWNSPATSPNKGHKNFASTAGGQNSSSRSPKKMRKLHFGSPAQKGSANVSQKKYSASRFSRTGGDGWRNYEWW